MCFSVKVTKKISHLEKRFNATAQQPELFTSGNEISGFTFPKIPVITNESQEHIQFYNWGLIPHWAKDDNIKKHTLNARVETLEEKPSFRDVVQQRCLVLVNGFYEWQWKNKSGTNKQKYHLSVSYEETFAFGGLYSKWTNTLGEEINSFTIVTTAAQGIMKEIHNSKQRMPIILSPKDEGKWLNNYDTQLFTQPSIDINAQPIGGHGTLSLF